MQTGSSETLIGWISGQTTFVPLWDRMEGSWLRTLYNEHISDCYFFDAIELSEYRISHWWIQITIGLSDIGLRKNHRLFTSAVYTNHLAGPSPSSPSLTPPAPTPNMRVSLCMYIVRTLLYSQLVAGGGGGGPPVTSVLYLYRQCADITRVYMWLLVSVLGKTILKRRSSFVVRSQLYTRVIAISADIGVIDNSVRKINCANSPKSWISFLSMEFRLCLTKVADPDQCGSVFFCEAGSGSALEWKSRVRICKKVKIQEQDPDPDRIKVKSRLRVLIWILIRIIIRIRIKVLRVLNPCRLSNRHEWLWRYMFGWSIQRWAAN